MASSTSLQAHKYKYGFQRSRGNKFKWYLILAISIVFVVLAVTVIGLTIYLTSENNKTGDKEAQYDPGDDVIVSTAQTVSTTSATTSVNQTTETITKSSTESTTTIKMTSSTQKTTDMLTTHRSTTLISSQQPTTDLPTQQPTTEPPTQQPTTEPTSTTQSSTTVNKPLSTEQQTNEKSTFSTQQSTTEVISSTQKSSMSTEQRTTETMTSSTIELSGYNISSASPFLLTCEVKNIPGWIDLLIYRHYGNNQSGLLAQMTAGPIVPTVIVVDDSLTFSANHHSDAITMILMAQNFECNHAGTYSCSVSSATVVVSDETEIKEYVYGLSWDGDRLAYAVRGKGIALADKKGTPIKTIPTVDNCSLAYIHLCKSKLFYTDYIKNYLHCLDLIGEELWKSTFEEIKGPRNICTDETGNIFVAATESNAVYVISADGSKFMKLLGQDDGMSEPKAIYFNQQNSELIVANKRGELFICSLQFQ
ncbi:Hypothetical predicted protein [Mytilus galloprovincialis]|uniref:Uncharacterized protein n=1 Tax=Mytilus galloprovincialis TaxID=29158 RepID=A0A8B6EKF0_MYTGA|nr:Hypothetical predicted protein [Mytilus galloprovincialis]